VAGPHAAPAERPLARTKDPPPVLQSLAVTTAVAVAGTTDQFVVPSGTAGVTVDATVDDPAKVKPGSIRWSGGRAGGSDLTRLVPTGRTGKARVSATAGGVTKAVTIHVPASALPGANAAARRTHTRIGRSNPGGDFGLTVVTIGQQGVKTPTFDVDAHIDGANWAFRVRAIRHGFKVGVSSQGRTDIAGVGDRDIKPSSIGRIIPDLTPPGAGATNGPPRAEFWSRTITEAHEQAHVDRFYTDAAFWPAAMDRFETTVEATSVAFNPSTPAAASVGGVLKANKAAFKTAADTEHGAADAAEIGGSEAAAHGVSNPMYTTLIAAIRDSVAPPAPTGLTAAAAGADSATISWTVPTTANETGFVVERRGRRGGFVEVGQAAVGDRTFTDTGLTAGERLSYRVRAVGAAGNSQPSNAGVVTLPAAPGP
jgi:hypothetical protein